MRINGTCVTPHGTAHKRSDARNGGAEQNMARVWLPATRNVNEHLRSGIPALPRRASHAAPRRAISKHHRRLGTTQGVFIKQTFVLRAKHRVNLSSQAFNIAQRVVCFSAHYPPSSAHEKR